MLQNNYREDTASAFCQLHPLNNVFYLIGIITLTIITANPIYLFISLCCSGLYNMIWNGVEDIKKVLFFSLPISFFTVIIQPLFSHSGQTALFYINNAPVTLESMFYGASVSVMLVSSIQWFRCFYHIIASDKLVYLTGRLFPSVSLTISMIFHFISLMKVRFIEIDEAQKMMQNKQRDQGIWKRISLFIKELSILIAWSLESSIEVSDSMESRGYGVGKRTSFHLYRWKRKDSLFLFFCTFLFSITLIGIIKDSIKVYYFPYFTMNMREGYGLITVCSFLIYGILPTIYDLGGMLKWYKLNLKM